MTDYIRKAVELANGWDFSVAGFVRCPIEDTDQWAFHALPQMWRDALAAQLVRQVDAVFQSGEVAGTLVIRESLTYIQGERHTEFTGEGRTMNTIKAIVDSGVLA